MIVGLTGGIGSGKSTAADIFKKIGITVVDADAVARDVVAPGSSALRAIVSRFGADVLDDESLNRSKLRDIIFKDREQKAWLESLLHPLIRESMFKQLSVAQGPYKILEAPLLFENNLHKACVKSILVDVPRDIQISRTTTRDSADQESVVAIIESQMPRDEKLSLTDYVLDNSGGLDDLEPQILRLDQVLQLLANNPDFQ